MKTVNYQSIFNKAAFFMIDAILTQINTDFTCKDFSFDIVIKFDPRVKNIFLSDISGYDNEISVSVTRDSCKKFEYYNKILVLCLSLQEGKISEIKIPLLAIKTLLDVEQGIIIEAEIETEVANDKNVN